jgi:hypothetical protein
VKVTTLKQNDFKRQVGLDHFFVGFTGEEIRDLKALAKLPFCSFAKVKSGKDSWQGVYWTAAQSHYFEMVETPKPGYYQFGLALSANAVQYFDVRRVQDLFGAERFHRKLRRIGGIRWFDAIYAGPESHRGSFFWLMHYYFCPRDKTFPAKDLPSVVQRFRKLEILAPRSFLKELKETGFWVPMRKTRTRNNVTLEFRHKDRSLFSVRVLLDPAIEHVQFVSLAMEASPFPQRLPKMRLFTLDRKGDALLLRRKLNRVR